MNRNEMILIGNDYYSETTDVDKDTTWTRDDEKILVTKRTDEPSFTDDNIISNESGKSTSTIVKDFNKKYGLPTI
jgi:hypothetical protein